MGLSNTATPRYYAEFRELVMSGQIPVCREISLEMNRIDKLIANPNVWYDEEAVEGFIRYCENELTLTDGSDLNLLPTFKLWAEQIFCWYYFVPRQVPEPHPSGHGTHYVTKIVKRRLTVKQYLIVARGAAKSLYESCIQSYFLVVDTSTTKQITTAPTMKQAEEIMGPIQTSITRARGPLFKFLTEGSLQNTTGNRALRQKLVHTKKGVENFLTGSLLEVRPMAINKLQGLRTKCNTVDEWLSGDLREDVVGAIEQGASKVEDYLIVAVSSEGTVRNGAGDTMKLELADILKNGGSPHISIWHYKLDEVNEYLNPDMWIKAQPNIGITVSWEVYQLDVERMERAPQTRNDILAKRFGIPMEGYTYFFPYEETIPHRPQNFMGLPCALGADLSQGDDFCAFTFMFPLSRERFGVKTRSYITERTLMQLDAARREKYEEFIAEGSLGVMPGTYLDIANHVLPDLDTFIQNTGYDVRAMGYDTYNSKEFLAWYEANYGPFNIEKVIQGAKTESVPLGELKNLSEDRLLLFDESLMQYSMGNCMVIEDTNGNLKLWKRRYDDKIDPVAALMDAWIAYKVNKEAFE